MYNLNKILDLVEKTGKEIIISRENGDSYVVMKLENYEKLYTKEPIMNSKVEDDYAISVKKLIMP